MFWLQAANGSFKLKEQVVSSELYPFHITRVNGHMTKPLYFSTAPILQGNFRGSSGFRGQSEADVSLLKLIMPHTGAHNSTSIMRGGSGTTGCLSYDTQFQSNQSSSSASHTVTTYSDTILLLLFSTYKIAFYRHLCFKISCQEINGAVLDTFWTLLFCLVNKINISSRFSYCLPSLLTK